MSFSKEFLAPKLNGSRFEDHTLPLNLFEDFTALEELIFEVAKQIYLEENPQRQRVPKGFTDDINLKLVGIEKGSAIPKILLVSTIVGNTLLPNIPQDSVNYIEKSRDRVIEVISQAQSGDVNPDLLDQKYLNYFNRIGRNLQDGESMDFAPGSLKTAILNKTIRKKILLSRSEKIEYSEPISGNAAVSLVDKDTQMFMLNINGTRVSCPIDDSFRDVIYAAFFEYEKNTLVAVKAIGIYNDQDKLVRIENIESMDILDPFDVNVRLTELSKMTDNWYEGTGKRPSPTALKAFAEYFNNYYGNNLPLPSIFPTVEGNIQMEWSLSNSSIMLEVFLNNFQGVYLNASNGEIIDEDLMNLENQTGWSSLNDKIQALI